MSSEQVAAEIRRGMAARGLGNYPAALKCFETAITLDPEDPLPLFHAGNINFVLTRNALALKLANAGLAMPCSRANRSFGLQVRALALTNLNLTREGEAAAAEAVANEPENASNHRVHAQTLWRLKKFKAAEAAFAKALALGPEVVSTLTAYARYLAAMRRPKEAMAMIERAAAIEVDQFDVMLLRGQIAFRLGQVELARDMAFWALSRNATSRPAIELLAMIKSRQSWLTGPFWRAATFLQRRSRLSVRLAFLCLGAFGAMLAAGLPQAALAGFGGVDLPHLLILAALGYMLLAVGHVALLVQKDRRQVKLKRNF